MNGLAESVADRSPDSLQFGKGSTHLRSCDHVNRKVARLLNVGSEACAR